jgi:transcriptional antiterminator RfaH
MLQRNTFAASFELAPVLPLSEAERWYVARTLPQRELHAARQLANQGFRTFVPRHWKNRRHARKVETISAPLFPRYIFVVVDRTRDRWRCINGTLGVNRLLMHGCEPQVVPVGVVENLVAAADAQGNIRFDFHLKEGQTVKVMAGPFAELVGQLERLDDNGRVRVLLEILGGKIRGCATAEIGCAGARCRLSVATRGLDAIFLRKSYARTRSSARRSCEWGGTSE